MSDLLAPLLLEGVIDEIGARLKSGKEADLWLVRHGGETVAAKVYKARQVRSFRNNVGYKEGRRVRNTRTQRAMDRGSRFGQASSEEAWKTREADALHALYAAGVRVPKPVMFYEGVLLMELVVDAHGHPAPRLIDTVVRRDQAAALYADLRGQAVRMLTCDLIHGDLSPYNVLLGRSGPVVIDFPQVVGAAHNSQAEMFFRRDLENLRHFFAEIDPALHTAAGDAREIWRAYVKRELTPDFIPSGRVSAGPPTRSHPGERHPPRLPDRTPRGLERRRDEGGGHRPFREASTPSHPGTRVRFATAGTERHGNDLAMRRGQNRHRHRGAPVPEVIRVGRPPLRPEGKFPETPRGTPSGRQGAPGAEQIGAPRTQRRRRRRRSRRTGPAGQ